MQSQVLELLGNQAIRWLFLALVVICMILGPFFLIDGWTTEAWLEMSEILRPKLSLAALLIFTTLAADILLPVPSSLVSIFAGATLGIWLGTLIIWAGMTIGCWIGYTVGRYAGTPLMRWVVGPTGTEKFRNVMVGIGAISLVLTRGLPVLAETMVLGAGASRMPVIPFVLLTASANLALALAYSAVGHFALSNSSFLILFLGLTAIPTISWLIWLRVRV